MKRYISAAALLIAGIVAVATSMFVVYPIQQSLNTTATTPLSPQGQSAFFTSTTSLEGATITEILVNTSIQFPIGDSRVLPSALSNSVQIWALIVLLCVSTLMIGLLLSREAYK